ncbi:zinc finger protein 729-like isoform X1 [Pieris brassicae]|uniref:zinc finger protein 729-like isoform X1 n=1 Tax=Pieris brassicae TaxID=7116 RepID=UPI001E65E270|nr:zinc finger protein 729-like isoform X1 [Pieris brassicae]XP_045513861.1 zinc finger protein 729-like isoform X1 [Pieris brassicae]XP_045513862.1 zinc finger protein 729-like isoform X1 [Pieris brassicae]XP_045513863.1 zinc finger protein 729-like isoform X1 [Pieris brassicae]
MADPPPLVLCMDNINGDEVTLKIDPHDDFRLFFDKAKSQLGFDIDLNSITGNQPVSLDDNIYQFFINNQQNVSRHISDTYIQSGYSDIDKENDDLVYVLDDGTQINATQIQFDNEDPLIDLTAEKIPFVKYTDDPVEENDLNENISIKDFHIDSPVSRWSSRNSSPTRAKSFINSLPFKSICNNTSNYELQFRKYLESNTKTYAVLNTVNRAASPTTIIKDNYKKYDDNQKDVFTREDILNMFKDSPVTHLPYDKSINYDKRKHSRKSDPSRIVHKNWYKSNLDSGPNQDCCICGKIIRNNYEKMYLFDNEDQRIHRCSPQKRTSVQLKIICEQCLEDHFKLCLVKSPNESLNSDEYLVIKNNQQYIFQNITDIDLKKKFSDQNKDRPLKAEINGGKESSSDVEIIEPQTELDKAIDNVDEADEEVKEFLGKYQTKHLAELKCRFCDKIFVDLPEVMDHCEEHKHDLDEEAVFPCPLCDYGYANLKWLKGHLKTAHEPPKGSKNAQNEDKVSNDVTSKTSSPVATRTRSAAKKIDDVEQDENEENKSVIEGNMAPMQLETIVKQETLDSDDEDIWIVHTGDDVDEQLQSLLKFNEVKNEKVQLSQKVNELIKHKCFNCSRIFPNAETLNTHKCRKRGRKRKSPTDTVLCVPSKEDFFKRAQGRPKQTNDDSLLKIRKKRSRSGSPQIVTCHNCNESFSSKVRLKFHMQFHEKSALQTEDGLYKCNECKETTFLTETELFDHIHFQHSKQKRWQCPVKDCGKTFFLRATLTKHSRTHTDTRRYVCVTCGKRFLDKQTLDEHGVTHLQIKPFQCHICLKQLTRRSRLRMHLRAHEEELCPKLVLVCGICSRAFRDHTDAQEHITKSSECIETFANEIKQDEPTERLSPTSGLVTQAAKTESTFSKPIPREVSQEESQDLIKELDESSKAIVRVVRIEKAFRCEYCEDVFYLEGALNSHRIQHKGVKNPFVCHVCKVSFATYSRCTTHKTTHGFYKRNLSDGKKEESASSAGVLGYGGFPVVKHFLCEDCGRSYLHWTYLQVHRRLKHANENFLFKCNQCELTFPNSWSVAYHRKKIHGKTAHEDGGTTKIARQDYYRIPCRDCDQVLPNKFELYKHRQKEHCDEALDDYEEMNKDSTICPKCGHNLHNVNALQKHLKEVHGVQNDSVRNEPIRSLNVLRRPPMRRTFNCPRCSGRFRQVTELQTHLRLKHPSFTIVIELENTSLTREDVLKQLSLHNIPRESVSEAYYISVPMGIPHIIPNSPQALEMLSNSFPRTDVILDNPNEGLAN